MQDTWSRKGRFDSTDKSASGPGKYPCSGFKQPGTRVCCQPGLSPTGNRSWGCCGQPHVPRYPWDMGAIKRGIQCWDSPQGLTGQTGSLRENQACHASLCAQGEQNTGSERLSRATARDRDRDTGGAASGSPRSGMWDHRHKR